MRLWHFGRAGPFLKLSCHLLRSFHGNCNDLVTIKWSNNLENFHRLQQTFMKSSGPLSGPSYKTKQKHKHLVRCYSKTQEDVKKAATSSWFCTVRSASCAHDRSRIWKNFSYESSGLDLQWRVYLKETWFSHKNVRNLKSPKEGKIPWMHWIFRICGRDTMNTCLYRSHAY